MSHFKIHILLAFSFLVLCAVGSKAEAAPLCVQVTGVPASCVYVDPNQCRQEAIRLGGICAANPAEFPTTAVGNQQFCVVESNMAMSCIYPDRQSCSNEGARRGGTCVTAAPRPHPPLDPYEERRPYFY